MKTTTYKHRVAATLIAAIAIATATAEKTYSEQQLASMTGEWTGPELIDGIPQDGTILQGDILIPPGVELGAVPTVWTDRNVYFQFDANMTSTMKGNLLRAMDLWMHDANANVRFMPRRGQLNYVHIRYSGNDATPANNSYVGMIGGEQILNIKDHDEIYIGAHELAHAAGFWHEQSRPDRDTYVQINFGNVQNGFDHNFDIQSWIPGTWDTPYDFLSIMHYDQCAFASSGFCPIGNTETIDVLPPNGHLDDDIGNRDSFGAHDAADMWAAYGYGRSYWVYEYVTPGTGSGSLRFPWGRVFPEANNVPSSARNLWLNAGTYNNSAGIYDKPLTWSIIPGGGPVTLQ